VASNAERCRSSQSSSADPKEFFDNRFIKELEDSGFIKELYAQH
jgi:hypothetical protein